MKASSTHIRILITGRYRTIHTLLYHLCYINCLTCSPWRDCEREMKEKTLRVVSRREGRAERSRSVRVAPPGVLSSSGHQYHSSGPRARACMSHLPHDVPPPSRAPCVHHPRRHRTLPSLLLPRAAARRRPRRASWCHPHALPRRRPRPAPTHGQVIGDDDAAIPTPARATRGGSKISRVSHSHKRRHINLPQYY